MRQAGVGSLALCGTGQVEELSEPRVSSSVNLGPWQPPNRATLSIKMAEGRG